MLFTYALTLAPAFGAIKKKLDAYQIQHITTVKLTGEFSVLQSAERQTNRRAWCVDKNCIALISMLRFYLLEALGFKSDTPPAD
ncbi:MAG: hypothetical protein ACR2QW_18510 [bacterium]